MEKTVKGITVEEYDELRGYKRMVDENAVRLYVDGQGYLFYTSDEVFSKMKQLADLSEENAMLINRNILLENELDRNKKYIQDMKERFDEKEKFYLDKIFSIKKMSIWEFIRFSSRKPRSL